MMYKNRSFFNPSFCHRCRGHVLNQNSKHGYKKQRWDEGEPAEERTATILNKNSFFYSFICHRCRDHVLHIKSKHGDKRKGRIDIKERRMKKNYPDNEPAP